MLWESKVWIDGRFIDTQEGLGTPHYHRLGTLNPGKHRIAIRINNDMIYNIGDKGHSYGEYTQIIWNGILGKIELQSSPTLSIDRIKVYPHTSDNRLDISFDIQNHSENIRIQKRNKRRKRNTTSPGNIEYPASRETLGRPTPKPIPVGDMYHAKRTIPT